MNEVLASIVPVLGHALVQFVWQGGVIGLLAAALLYTLRNARPQARYAVACAAMFACVAVPAYSVIARLLASSPALRHATDPAGVAASAFWVFAPADRTAAAAPVLADAAAWQPLVVALWAAGAAVLCLRMALGVAWIEHLRNAPQTPQQRVWQRRLDALARRSGLTRPVALRFVERMGSPASAGWLRPVVLLPASLVARMPTDLIEALLAHELAHIRRHDYLVNLMQGVVESLLFYHPVVWWLSHQVRVEREHIADELAARALGTPRPLAHALAALSELQSGDCAPPRLAQAAHGGHLMSRIERLIRPGRAAAGRIAFPVLGIAAACVGFYAHAQISTQRPAAAMAPVTQAAPVRAAAAPVARVALPVPAAGSAGVLGLQAAVPNTLPATPQPAPTHLAPIESAALAVASAVATASAQAVAQLEAGDRPYALVRRGRNGMQLSGSQLDSTELESLRNQLNADFLWFRHDGRAYAVTDPDTLATARAAWQDSERTARRMEEIGREMSREGERMDAVGVRMSRLARPAGPSPEMRAAQKRMQELAAQQGRVAAEHARLSVGLGSMDEAINERIERRMEALELQMETLGEQMERQGERIGAEAERSVMPLEALGREMEAAARPMEALGRRMEALGREQERHAAEADTRMQAVIEDAIARGLARPVSPAARRQ